MDPRSAPAGAQTYIRLDKADFQFCAAHFCVFPGEREPLHGHNYRVYVELCGPADELGYVAEFGWIKRQIRDLVATLDHRVLIAEDCPALNISRDGAQLIVRWDSDCWSFPLQDVVCLPIKNATAEFLASYLWYELKRLIGDGQQWGALTVEVEETPGQRAGMTRPLLEA